MQMVQDAEKNKDADENFVKLKVDSMCGCPKKEKITFYKKEEGDDIECTLGRFLFNLSHLYTAQCEHCKEPMFRHFLQYYHKEGVVEI